MEEADAILLVNLAQLLGADSVKGIGGAADVTCHVLVRAAAKCLASINPDAPPPPEVLPPDMSGRFAVGTALASRIAALGYRGDIGFHQLLYPTEADVRAILAFLLDRLPRATASDAAPTRAVDADSGASRAREAIAALLRASRAKHAAAAEPQADVDYVPFWTVRLDVAAETPLTSQAQPPARLCPSIIELLADRAAAARAAEQAQMRRLRQRRAAADGAADDRKDLAARISDAIVGSIGAAAARHVVPAQLTGSAAAVSVSPASLRPAYSGDDAPPGDQPAGASPADAAQQRVQEREQELASVEQALLDAAANCAALEAELAQHEAAARLARQRAQEASTATKRLEEEYAMRKQTVALVTGSGDALANGEADLVAAVRAAEARLASLEQQWAEARRPLDERLEARRNATRRARERAEQQLQQIQEWRTDIRDIVAQIRARETAQQRLLAEYEAAPKNVNRATFVRRITEIIKNIKKQDVEIVKIIADTREVQREINSAQEALSRAYVLVDELIFRDAKKDDLCRDAYKILSAVHAGFADLTQRVHETGRVVRSIRDFERKLEEFAKRPVDLDRVLADVDVVMRENAALAQHLEMQR